jgi:hypothetical protein
MQFLRILCVFSWATSLGLVVASNIAVRARNVPGTTDIDTLGAIQRAILAVRVQGRDVAIQNTTSFEQSWNDAVLFSFAL